jgi:Starch-binding module 26/Chitobiase/beta-hexosaminidase C-terminal domain/Secretion system C-terminal sorting domain
MRNLILKGAVLACMLFSFSLNAQSNPSTYYQTNPTLGKKSTTAVTIDGNPTEWTQDMLIVQGVANDDARTFRGTHEGPVYDLYQLYATWDNTNLYLMWQIVNVSDIVSPEQGYPNSDNGKPWNGDIPFQLVFDTQSGIGSNGMLSGKTVEGVAASHIWGIYTLFDNNEADKIAMFSSKPGVGQPSIIGLNAAGAFDYAQATGFATAGVSYKWGDHSVPAKIYGINKNGYTGLTAALLGDATQYVDFNTLAHKKSFDTIYEMKIPLASLGIDLAYLESSGIGVMLVSTFGQSGINSLPYDAATTNNATEPYSSDASTSKEKEDVDHFTAPFARIAKAAGPVVVRPTLTVAPAGGTYIGGTTVTLTASGASTPIKIHYTLDGSTPTAASPFVSSGGTVAIPATNTTLKAVAIDATGTSSIAASHDYVTQAVASGIRIRVQDTRSWGAVKLYAWQGASTALLGAWPGTSMTKISRTWYEYVFAPGVSPFNIVINNGAGQQTPDIVNISTDKCYNATGTEVLCSTVTDTDAEAPTESEITLYPNPVNENLILSSAKEIQEIQVIDLTGKVVKSSTETTLQLSDIAMGMYFVNITFKDQSKVTRKIVKI